MKILIIALIILFIIYRILGRRTIVNIIRRSLGFGPIGSDKKQNISNAQPRRKKVFSKDDGEYVEYEEIKSTDKGKTNS